MDFEYLPFKELNELWRQLFHDQEVKPPFWRYKISTMDYQKLKSILAVCVEKDVKAVRNIHALKVAFYMSDFYKREYNGNDSAQNALQTIGMNRSESKKIWENAHLPEKYLYSTDYMTEWMQSIYVLGGLPIKRYSHGRGLFKNLWVVYNNDEEDLQDFFNQDINNTVVASSLQNESGSLHLFVNELIDKDAKSMFNAADLELEPFAPFIKNLNEEKQDKQKNKIDIEWLFYFNDYDEQETSISKRLVFKLRPWGTEMSNQISSMRMNRLGLSSSDFSRFEVGVHFIDGNGEIITDESNSPVEFIITDFQKAKNGIFISWGLRRKYYCDNVPQKFISKIEFFLRGHDNEGNILDDKKISSIHIQEPFAQIYSTGNPFEWSTDKNSKTATRLLFDESCECDAAKGPNVLLFAEGEERYNCIPIEGIVKLKYNTKEYSFSKKNGTIEVKFKRYDEAMEYLQDGKMHCVVKEKVYNDEIEETLNDDIDIEEYLPVMFGKNAITVFYYPYRETSKESGVIQKKLSDNDFELLVKIGGSFVPWDDDIVVNFGKQRIRVKSKDTIRFSQEEINIFYIPFEADKQHSSPVMRFPQGKDEGDILFCPSLASHLLINKKVSENGTYHDTIAQGNGDTLIFEAGIANEDTVSYIELRIFRSVLRVIIYQDGIPFATNKRDVDIPFLMRDRFSVRIIDRNGVNKISCKDDESVSFQSFSSYSGLSQSVRGNYGVTYYLTKDKRAYPDRVDYLKIGRNSVHRYHFFFWNYNPYDEPVEVNGEYDSDTEIMHLDKHFFDVDGRKLIRRGVIFQSLKDGVPHNYCTPIVGSGSLRVDAEIFKKAIEVTSEHKLYFHVFDEIFKSFNEKLLTDIFCNFALSGFKTVTVQDLYRFSEEYNFSWILINFWDWKDSWKAVCKPKIEAIKDCDDNIRNNIIRKLDSLFYSNLRNLFMLQSKNERYYLKKIIDIEFKSKIGECRYTRKVAPQIGISHFNEKMVHCFMFGIQRFSLRMSTLPAEKKVILRDMKSDRSFFKKLYEYLLKQQK